MGRSAWRDSPVSLWHTLFVSDDSMFLSGENGTVHTTFSQITGSYILKEIIISSTFTYIIIAIFHRVGILI